MEAIEVFDVWLYLDIDMIEKRLQLAICSRNEVAISRSKRKDESTYTCIFGLRAWYLMYDSEIPFAVCARSRELSSSSVDTFQIGQIAQRSIVKLMIRVRCTSMPVGVLSLTITRICLHALYS